MVQQRLGIIMNGVTGRMGMNQHLIRSIVAIRAEGGVALRNGDRVMPDPILVGRNEAKLEALAKAHGITRWSTDLDAARGSPRRPPRGKKSRHPARRGAGQAVSAGPAQAQDPDRLRLLRAHSFG